MEEADNIILVTLHQSGCITDKNIVKFADVVEPNALVAIVSECLNRMGCHVAAVSKLPKGISSKHQVCSALTNALKESGYEEECDYSQFFYPEPVNTRRLLLWLLDNIPKTRRELVNDSDTGCFKVRRALEAFVKCQKQERSVACDFTVLRSKPEEDNVHTSLYMPLLSEKHPKRISLLGSLLKFNAAIEDLSQLSMGKNSISSSNPTTPLEDIQLPWKRKGSFTRLNPQHSRFAHHAVFTQEDSTCGSDIAEKKEKHRVQLENFETELKELQDKRQLMQNDIVQGSVQVKQLQSELHSVNEEMKELEIEYKTKKKIAKMLSDVDINTKKLQEACATGSRRLQDLEREWEKQSGPLLDAFQALEEGHAVRTATCETMMEEIHNYSKEMNAMTITLREKQEKKTLLIHKYESLPQSAIGRQTYVERIMDIIRQIRKQNVEIDKIVGDIRNVQKLINTESGKLKRSEALADERIYQAARQVERSNSTGKENVPAQVYRYLSQVRQLFDQLIRVVEDIGKVETQTRDVETKSKAMAQRFTPTTMDKVLSDMRQLQRENDMLAARV